MQFTVMRTPQYIVYGMDGRTGTKRCLVADGRAIKMSWFRVIVIWCSLICCCIDSSSAQGTLSCIPPSTCLGSPVYCGCQGYGINRWTVTTSAGTQELFELTALQEIGETSTSADGLYTGTVYDVNVTREAEGRIDQENSLIASTLDFNFTNDITVGCVDSSSIPLIFQVNGLVASKYRSH